MSLYPGKKQNKHDPKLELAILNQLLPVMGVATWWRRWDPYNSLSPFISIEIWAEETGSFEANLVYSFPQFDQVSPVTGVQPFVYELQAIMVSIHLPW